jgi:TonB family protein
MNEALMYFLKVNIAIALFYLFYRMVFYNDTFWATRRFYLVFSILLAAVYPLISVSGWLEKQEPMQAIMTNYVQLEAVTVSATPPSAITLENLLLAAYGIVSCFLFIKMVAQLVSILRWRLKGKKVLLNGVEIIAIDGTVTPFSFFTTIFMNPALHNEQETVQILTHECTHARQWHSLDVILSELLTICCWMNPACWLLKREIRHNLEFLADNRVLQSGIDSKEYQYHLLQLSYQVPENLLINKFNISPLKKRITMMNQQKTKKAGILKYSLIVPLALALVLSSNAEALVSKAKNIIAQKTDESSELSATTNAPVLSATNDPVLTEKKEAQIPEASVIEESKPAQDVAGDDKVYTVIEKMPQYPGGAKELMSYIARNLRYPVEAQKKGIQGKLFVRFIVTKSGKVEKAEVVRSVDPILDQEGLRVVNTLPDWIPGEQNGKKVSVYYTLPIAFKLDDGTKAESKPDKNAITVIGYKPLDKPKTAIDPNNPPVYIIDGVQQPKGIVNIKQETIASMNILKPDSEKRKAELIAQYGEQAANGVIIITTKK